MELEEIDKRLKEISLEMDESKNDREKQRALIKEFFALADEKHAKGGYTAAKWLKVEAARKIFNSGEKAETSFVEARVDAIKLTNKLRKKLARYKRK